MFSIQYSRVEFFGGGRELLGSPNPLSIRPKIGLNRAVLHLLIELGRAARGKGVQEL